MLSLRVAMLMRCMWSILSCDSCEDNLTEQILVSCATCFVLCTMTIATTRKVSKRRGITCRSKRVRSGKVYHRNHHCQFDLLDVVMMVGGLLQQRSISA